MNKKNNEIITKALANDLINGEIQNFKEIDKGCEMSIPFVGSQEEQDELMAAWNATFAHLREIGCISASEIDAKTEFTPEVQRKYIEDSVDCHNEFAECGDDILFVDDLYITESDEVYDGIRETYLFKKKNQHMPKSMFSKNISKLKEIIDKNDAIIWELPQVTRITSITNRVVTSPKRTALLFEKWMREENPLKFNYDDISVKFEDRNGIEYFVVRMSKMFINKVNKKIDQLSKEE